MQIGSFLYSIKVCHHAESDVCTFWTVVLFLLLKPHELMHYFLNRHFSWQNSNVLLVICKKYHLTSHVLSLLLKIIFKHFKKGSFQMA